MADILHSERLLHSRITRRNLLVGAGALTGLAFANSFSYGQGLPHVSFPDYPFTLGVASGDPYPTSVVLWTRLAPEPLQDLGGMPDVKVPIRWQVAKDDRMRHLVAQGTEIARPELAHSVRVVVEGLQPDTWYWYRFIAGREESPVGHTRTAPRSWRDVDKLTFAFVSCQHYEQGYYTAYKYMAAQEDLDLVVHLGDYIYEGGISTSPNNPRRHNSAEIRTLEDYRKRHALYKTDVNLQATHAAFPWIVTWDDHEVENNYADDISEVDTEPDQDPQVFLQRRAMAYQAYYEHMPLRPSAKPQGPDMQLFRRLAFGNLATFHVLDTRQYRTDQPCGDGTKARCGEEADPEATITGRRQEQWLYRGLEHSPARWNIIAQQVIVAQRDTTPGEGQTFSMDKWDGYLASRNRLMRFLELRKPSNPVVLTGDVHSNWAMELKADFDDPGSATVGTEFVGTSVSSGGNGADTSPTVTAYLPDNPHIKFYNGQRGYVRCELTPEEWKTEYKILSQVTTDELGTLSTRATFVIENGHPEIQPG